MVKEYTAQLQRELVTGNALEHSYRPAFKSLIEGIDPSIIAVNEPTRSAHGAPDFVFLNRNNKDLIFGYAETKDLNVNLDLIEKSEQLKRYLGYPNLILTNYLEFRFFRNGEKHQTIKIAEIKHGVIHNIEVGFSTLEHEVKAFLSDKPETIRSAEKLAKIMGVKASRIRDNVQRFLSREEDIKNTKCLIKGIEVDINLINNFREISEIKKIFEVKDSEILTESGMIGNIYNKLALKDIK